MTPLRKDLIKRLVYIFLGISTAMIFAGPKKPDRYIAVLAFLIASYHVIRIIIVSQLLFNDFFPVRRGAENDDSLSNNVIYSAAVILFIGGVAALGSQITPIENTINGGCLLVISAAAGLLIGSGIVFLLKSKFPTLFNASDRRFSVILGFGLGFIFIVPALATIINREFSGAGTDHMALPTITKFREGIKYYSYHVTVRMNGAEEKFEITLATYKKLSVGDTLYLDIKHGVLGYDFVKGYPTALGVMR